MIDNYLIKIYKLYIILFVVVYVIAFHSYYNSGVKINNDITELNIKFNSVKDRLSVNPHDTGAIDSLQLINTRITEIDNDIDKRKIIEDFHTFQSDFILSVIVIGVILLIIDTLTVYRD